MTGDTDSEGRSRRGGGRAARQAARQDGAAAAERAVPRGVPFYEPFSLEQLHIIEANADTILQETGLDFRGDPEVLALWKQAGADVRGERVRFPAGLLRGLIMATAPARFIQHARNPARSVEIGGTGTVMAPAYGSPFVRDLTGGRRYATLADFIAFVKLTYLSPALRHSGGTVCEPVDRPVATRHLDMVHAHMRYSDKPFMGSVTAPERAADSVEMCRILFGADFVDRNCVMVSLINVNSPLVYDATMLGALKVYARAGQACVVSPFILSGAMSPVTVAGTMAQTLAEAMAGIALTQLLRPGAPVIFGTFSSTISMQSGAPTFGSAEASLTLYGMAQLARRLNLPFRSGGSFTASKIADAQAAAESALTLNTSILAGVNFMLHAAGWLEGGLTIGYEKFIIDVDQLNVAQRFLGGAGFTELDQAMDAIREVGPGSHYLGCSHTRQLFKSAFYNSRLADNNSFEQWLAEGGRDIATRAHDIYHQMLASYQEPPLDPAVAEALDAFVSRRKAELHG